MVKSNSFEKHRLERKPKTQNKNTKKIPQTEQNLWNELMFEIFKFLAKTYFFPEVPIPLDMPHYFKGQCFNPNNRKRHSVSRTRAQT